MRLVSKMMLAALAFGAYSTSASAAVQLFVSTPLTSTPGVPGPAVSGQTVNAHTFTYTETMVWDFDTIADSRFSYQGNVAPAGGITDIAAEPVFDTTKFGVATNQHGVDAGNSFITQTDALFTVKPGTQITSFSFDLGSLDTFNMLTFEHNGVAVAGGTFTGFDLTDPNPADGNQTSIATNRRYYFTFNAADGVNNILFHSDGVSFEFDNIAATVSSVPEPATWAMMILGFGFVGFMMRSNRQKTAMIAA